MSLGAISGLWGNNLSESALRLHRIEVGRSGKSRIRGINEGTADLAKRLSFALNRPIIDRTGLINKYDYAVIFDTSAFMPPPNPTATDSDTPTPIDLLGSSIGS